MKKTKYTQCLLQKGEAYQTSWIPSKFAVVGMVLKIKDDADRWVNGWVVQAAYSEVEDEDLPDYRRAIRNHRKRTGDSLPKNSIEI
jgi:hypothetical protein